jgi:hypothetical protein
MAMLFAYTLTSIIILPLGEVIPVRVASKPKFDLADIITRLTGLVLFRFTCDESGAVTWHVPYTYIFLIVYILFFVTFPFINTYIARHPPVPVNMLSKKAVFAPSIVACGWASFGICVSHLSQLIRNLQHHSILSSAAQQNPVAFSGLVASLLVGISLPKAQVAHTTGATLA